jgi:hypothetical protein
VSNTLQDRMNLVFEMALPRIREMLFREWCANSYFNSTNLQFN